MAPRVLVTRQPEQAGELSEGLRRLGIAVVEVPLIEIAPVADPRPLDEALARLDRYDWLVFTSANAVAAVADRLAALGLGGPLRTPVASVGPATSAAIARRLPGARIALEPATEHRAEGLLLAFRDHALRGSRVLVPSSERARDVLPSGLRERGAEVDAPAAYRTLPAPDRAARLASALDEGVDVVTFASPSAVEAFTAAMEPGRVAPSAAVIGPVTEEAARQAGLTVVAVATPSTAAGLVEALRGYFLGWPPNPQ